MSFMKSKGDTENQAIIRDKKIKEAENTKDHQYISTISSEIKPGNKILDIGCGTAHIIQELATQNKNASFVGLDISPAMVKIAEENTDELHNVKIVEGDGLKLPFPSCSFDIVTARLADFSPEEVYRILKSDGIFFEYGLGPDADKEIAEFFPDRIEQNSFFIPKSLNTWKEEASHKIKGTGLTIESMEDFREMTLYENEEELMDLIEMVPLLRDFDREKDKKAIAELAGKYRDNEGIKITWHYYILQAKRI